MAGVEVERETARRVGVTPLAFERPKLGYTRKATRRVSWTAQVVEEV